MLHYPGLNLQLQAVIPSDDAATRAFDERWTADSEQRKTHVPPGPKPASVAPGQIWARWVTCAALPITNPVFIWVSSVHDGDVWGAFTESIPDLQRARVDAYPTTSDKLLADPAWHFIGMMPSPL